MLTRSRQRLLENNENINNENQIKPLKRKRNTQTNKIDKENVIPTNIRYSLRSRNKLKDNVLALKSQNDNITKEKKTLKEKILNTNIINNSLEKSLIKSNILKDHNINNNNNNINKKNLKKPLKEKINTSKTNSKATDKENSSNNNKKSSINQNNNETKIKNSKLVVLINNNNNNNNVINNSIIDTEPKSKKVKVENKVEKQILKSKDIENKQINSKVKSKIEKKSVIENDHKSALKKSSITKKKDSNVLKEKKKITFNDKVEHIENSLVLDSFSSSNSNNSALDSDNNKVLKMDDSLSPIKKQTNDIIVPFIRLDSTDSAYSSSSSSSINNNSSKDSSYQNIEVKGNNDNDNNNKLERKVSGLSDKSLEILNDFTRGGNVQLSDLLESLNGSGHLKSSTPNNFNKTLLFLEESPINYTRILNEEMNFRNPLSGTTKSPEKEVSNYTQNTSFQDSNSLSNFINISPISNSDIHPTDSDFDHLSLQPHDLMDENDLFNTDLSSIYNTDELDEKIKKLLSGNDNYNFVSDDENKSILRYTPISSEKLNTKRKIDENEQKVAKLSSNKNSYSTVNSSYSIHRTHPSSSSRYQRPPAIIEEITYDQPDNIDYLVRQDSISSSSSDDPFGFSKAEKIYKEKQQELKQYPNSVSQTPTKVFTLENRPRYSKLQSSITNTSETTQNEKLNTSNPNEVLLQEHEQLLEEKRKNRHRKKVKVEDMEELNSDDLEEIKKAKDQQMKLFKEIDDYVLNESVL